MKRLNIKTEFRWLLVVLIYCSTQTSLAQKQVDSKLCYYVSSYHQTHPWSFGIESELKKQLKGICEFKAFYLNGKRNKEIPQIRAQVQVAKKEIDALQPDIVITSDDIAAKYLVVEQYKYSNIPFVFCGVNWSAERLGLPLPHTTGLIEVAPIRPLLDLAKSIVKPVKRAMYLGADTETEKANLERFKLIAEKYNIQIDGSLSSYGADWLKSLKEAQEYDLIILGSNEGIYHWSSPTMIHKVKVLSKKLTVTNHSWMMPYTIIGLTKLPEEQGEWAGKIVKEILAGASPREIPITANRDYKVFINPVMKNKINLELPKDLEIQAEFVQ